MPFWVAGATRLCDLCALCGKKKQKMGNANKYQKPLFLRPRKYLPTGQGAVPTTLEPPSHGQKTP
jgi:hypothetical protein